MKLDNHYLTSAVFSVILVTGIIAIVFPIQEAFAADEKQKVEDKDKKPLKQVTQSTIKSLKGLKTNENRVIIFYKNDIQSEDLSKLSEKGASVKASFSKMRGVVVHIDKTKLKDLQLDSNIARVVEDKIVHASLSTSIPQIGANLVHTSGITGQGVKTCIVDTGVDDTHPALNPLIAQFDFVNNDSDATDDHGHGTHVAGIIASKDATFRGVATGSSLMAAKVLDSNGQGFFSDVISGIDWCVTNGADVINLSLGGDAFLGTCDSEPDAMAVNNAVAAGVVVTAASGNDGWLDAISQPACASGAIAVGAIDDFDGRTEFSNEGPQLDVVAPGVDIVSLNAPIRGGGFTSKTGTSMAAPHVAGLAALILDANPALTPVQVKSAIQNNALDLGDPGFDTIYGNGRIQASNSVNSILPPTITLSDVSVSEGNSGTTTAAFSVTLSQTYSGTVSVDYATQDISAKTSDNDYVATSGTLVFTAGQTTKTISVIISGDLKFEPNETFYVNLSNPINAVFGDPQAIGTILNDDYSPTGAISVNTGGVGTIIGVSGFGFAPSSIVSIKFDGTTIATATATSGNFINVPITIPPSTPGIHTITGTDGTHSFSSTFIVVAPRLTATETASSNNIVNLGSPGSVLNLYLKGFAGNDPTKQITVLLNGIQVGTQVSPGKIGSYKAFSLNIPTTPASEYNIAASDGTNTASMTFRVASLTIRLSSYSGISGDSIVVTGTGFIPNHIIHISFDGSPPVDVMSTSSGRILGAQIVVTGTSGAHTITATDDTNSASSTFVIS
jgi:subtilisin family serine protease